MIDSLRNIDCDKCSLAGICNNVCIMGSGNAESKVMFIAEAPTQAEDREGATFESIKYDLFWKVLDKVLGKKSEDYYYTTIVKCAPGEGRYIEEEEITNCRKYLEAEIEAIKPTCIITLGAIAMEALTGQKGITTKRGTVMQYNGSKSIPVIPTYSPNYVERRMQSSKSALEQFAKDINKGILLSASISDKREFTKVKTCKTIEDVHELIGHIIQVGEVVLDFETEGLDYKIHRPTMLGASYQIGAGWAIPLYHFESPFSEKEVIFIMETLRVQVWENPNIRKIGQNFKFDMHFANAYTEGGINPVKCEDIINMHHILDENSRHGLKIVGPRYFPQFEGYEDEVGKYKWAEVPLDVLAPYCVADTDLTFRLLVAYECELLQYPELYRLYRNLANPALQWTFEAEKEGMLIDREYLVESINIVTGLIDEKEKAIRNTEEVLIYDKHKRDTADADLLKVLEEKLEKAKARAKDGANRITANYEQRIRAIKIGQRDKDSFDKINFGSPKQMGELLYGEVGFKFEMPYDRKKRRKAPSTEKKYLEDLNDTSGFIKNLIEWRRMSKLSSTYFHGILDRLDINNRLHTDFLIYGTTTGRFSSRNPNLQNIPRKGNDAISEIAKRVKNCFIAPKGYNIMQCIAEGYRVHTRRGLLKIENVTTEDEVYHNGKYYPISRTINNGKKSCYKITTNTGREIITTDNHKFKTVGGFTEVKDFKKGEILYLDNIKNSVGDDTYIQDGRYLEYYIAGFIMGDGFYIKNTKSGYIIGISLGKDSKVLKPVLDRYFQCTGYLSDKGDYKISNKKWYNYFKNLYPKNGSYDVQIPEIVWRGDKVIRQAFLAGALDSDGSYHSDRLTISSVCKKWIQELQLLSNSIGCYGIIRKTDRPTNYSDRSILYHLDLFTNTSVFNFPKGLLERKNNRRVKGFTQCRTDFVPYELIEKYKNSGIQKTVLGNRLFTNGRRNNRVTRDALKKAGLLDKVDNFMYETAVSIEEYGIHTVYDLTIPGMPVFSVNGLIVHNCDYSQAELRLVAEYAKEDTMIKAYAEDKDLHAMTAWTIKRMTEEGFNELEDAERSDERFKAKAANFGLIYGMQADSYQDYKKHEYGIESTYEECVKERHLYFKHYPKLLPWHKRQMVEAKKNGYVTTLFGRRRRLLDINNTDDFIRSLAERQSINSPIQGTGGEYTSFSASILRLRLKVLDERIIIVNSVHDSLLPYVPKDIQDEASKLIQTTMENPPVKEYFDFELDYVNMKVDCEIGSSWGTLN